MCMYIAKQPIRIDFCRYKLKRKQKKKKKRETKNEIKFDLVSTMVYLKHHTCISDVLCVSVCRKASLLSSNDCSISSGIVSTGFVVKGIIGGAGVMAVCIGTVTVEGVEGTGIGIAFGVLFSSSTKEIVFKGVVVT